ncbi:MAG: hypothetical protein NTV81_03645 [Candidatus Komeilibacteria bacterium]|nr:hypothetical protein [Candidatus Komeilibacteria bacterium]
MGKYNSPEDVPDSAIIETYSVATSVKFGWWFPLTRVLPLIGVTPQMLKPVFDSANVYVPDEVREYAQLGMFPLVRKAFIALAKILNKPVEVEREEGGSGFHRPVFTSYPSGRSITATKA